MRSLTLALLLAATNAAAADFMGKSAARGAASPADASLCPALGQSRDRIRAAFMRGADFPDKVYAAFDGQGSGEATAGNYLTRGQELFQLVETVQAQCQAVLGYGAGPRSESEAAAIRRRVQSAKRTADLYLDLPATVANIDSRGDEPGLALRPQFLTAMYKIADGGNYEAAAAIADAAHASLSRLRK